MCDAGYATMDQLLEIEGRWTTDLVELMIPRAVEIRMHRVADQTKATLAALGSMFSKEALEEFNDGVRFMESLLLSEAYEARGLEAPRTGTLPPHLAKIARTMDGLGQEAEASAPKDPRLTKRSTRR